LGIIGPGQKWRIIEALAEKRTNMIRRYLENPVTLTAVVAVLLLAVAAAPGQQSNVAVRSKSEFRTINPVTALTAATFAQPPVTDRPWVFWNIPPTAEPGELKAEVKQMRDAGIGGALTGQGYYPNDAQLIAMLEAGSELGVTISTWSGPTLGRGPASSFSANDENATKTLVFGKATVDAGQTFEGALPPVLRGAGRGGRGAAAARTTLVAVLAYRCTRAPCPASGVAELDRASVIDLTSTVTGTNTAGVLRGTTAGSIRWTAPASPAGAQWQLISFWSRGDVGPDQFSKEGHEQYVKNMMTSDKSVLSAPLRDASGWHFPEADFTSPRIAELMKADGGDIFYDSDYLPRNNWTNKMPEEFQTRKGYSVIPSLAAFFADNFSFSDGTAPRVRNDLYAIRTDLWTNNQIKPLRDFLLSQFNWKFRLQPETVGGIWPEQMEVAAALDRPEHESLCGEDEVDIYRPIASVNHMTGNTWYSTECCAVRTMNYTQTFKDVVIRMNKAFAGGMTKASFHVYPYRDAPSASEMYPAQGGGGGGGGDGYRTSASTWPGFDTFAPTAWANVWGPREPFWADALFYIDYFARNQQVLTQGDARTDVAVYMHAYLYPRPGTGNFIRYWRDLKMERAGYTHDYLDPMLLDLPNATVTGRRLAVNGPAYKALIVDADLQPATDPVKTSMPLAVAQKILGYAQAGLPVIVIGAPPNQTEGNTPGDDARLQAVITRLLAEKTVRRAATEAEAPAVLKSLGVRPSAEPNSPSPMLSIHRRDAATRSNYYFLYNQGFVKTPGSPGSSSEIFEAPTSCRSPLPITSHTYNPCIGTGEAIDRMVTLEGVGQPYLLDAWTGKITPIANYTSDGKSVTVRAKLARDESMLIALSEDANRFGVRPPAVHVTKTSAGDVVLTEGNAVAIRASKAGTYTTTLSDGRSVISTIGNVPAPIDLTNAVWHLAAEDWQPVNPYATTFGLAATETRKAPVELDLKGLKAWPEIPELEHASGMGAYTTTVDLPAGWTSANGATLSLGEVFDTFTLTVNGKEVPVAQIAAEADIGPYLKAGRNTIAVRVATTYNNRLSVLDQGVASRELVEEYGLVGPVVLTPYGQAAVR
jgi:hypothetical protein